MPNRDYHNQRQNYELGVLSDDFLDANPLELFQQWMDDAFEKKVIEPTAMTLATVDATQQPHARIVLLKAFDKEGFVFYTHYESAKGRELITSKRAALSFFWPELERQVRIEGLVEKISPEASDRYFQSRPVDSQISAYISKQSQTVPNRETLEQRMAQAKKEFAGKPIPRPATWGGYRLIPKRFEFWQGRPNRLHDRIQFSIHPTDPQAWSSTRLSP
jgi:pyridoxamine 5'-phosphate oxidase